MEIYIMSGRKLIERTENPSNVPKVLFWVETKKH